MPNLNLIENVTKEIRMQYYLELNSIKDQVRFSQTSKKLQNEFKEYVIKIQRLIKMTAPYYLDFAIIAFQKRFSNIDSLDTAISIVNAAVEKLIIQLNALSRKIINGVIWQEATAKSLLGEIHELIGLDKDIFNLSSKEQSLKKIIEWTTNNDKNTQLNPIVISYLALRLNKEPLKNSNLIYYIYAALLSLNFQSIHLLLSAKKYLSDPSVNGEIPAEIKDNIDTAINNWLDDNCPELPETVKKYVVDNFSVILAVPDVSSNLVKEISKLKLILNSVDAEKIVEIEKDILAGYISGEYDYNFARINALSIEQIGEVINRNLYCILMKPNIISDNEFQTAIANENYFSNLLIQVEKIEDYFCQKHFYTHTGKKVFITSLPVCEPLSALVELVSNKKYPKYLSEVLPKGISIAHWQNFNNVKHLQYSLKHLPRIFLELPESTVVAFAKTITASSKIKGEHCINYEIIPNLVDAPEFSEEAFLIYLSKYYSNYPRIIEKFKDIKKLIQLLSSKYKAANEDSVPILEIIGSHPSILEDFAGITEITAIKNKIIENENKYLTVHKLWKKRYLSKLSQQGISLDKILSLQEIKVITQDWYSKNADFFSKFNQSFTHVHNQALVSSFSAPTFTLIDLYFSIEQRLEISWYGLAMPSLDFFEQNIQFFHWISVIGIDERFKIFKMLCKFFGWEDIAKLFNKYVVKTNQFTLYSLPFMHFMFGDNPVNVNLFDRYNTITCFGHFIASVVNEIDFPNNQLSHEEGFLIFLIRMLAKFNNEGKLALLWVAWSIYYSNVWEKLLALWNIVGDKIIHFFERSISDQEKPIFLLERLSTLPEDVIKEIFKSQVLMKFYFKFSKGKQVDEIIEIFNCNVAQAISAEYNQADFILEFCDSSLSNLAEIEAYLRQQASLQLGEAIRVLKISQQADQVIKSYYNYDFANILILARQFLSHDFPSEKWSEFKNIGHMSWLELIYFIGKLEKNVETSLRHYKTKPTQREWFLCVYNNDISIQKKIANLKIPQNNKRTLDTVSVSDEQDSTVSVKMLRPNTGTPGFFNTSVQLSVSPTAQAIHNNYNGVGTQQEIATVLQSNNTDHLLQQLITSLQMARDNPDINQRIAAIQTVSALFYAHFGQDTPEPTISNNNDNSEGNAPPKTFIFQ